MAHIRSTNLLVAQAQAKLQSYFNSIVYLHFFPVDNQYLVSTCRGSGKFVHSCYSKGKSLPVV